MLMKCSKHTQGIQMILQQVSMQMRETSRKHPGGFKEAHQCNKVT